MTVSKPTPPLLEPAVGDGFGATTAVRAAKVERPVSVQTLCPWAVVGGPP